MPCGRCRHRVDAHEQRAAAPPAQREKYVWNNYYCTDCRECLKECPECGHGVGEHEYNIAGRSPRVLYTTCADCSTCVKAKEPEPVDASCPFMVGEVVPGWCGGVFPLDTMGTELRVEAVGHDWIVLRGDNGGVHFYSGDHASLRRDADGERSR